MIVVSGKSDTADNARGVVEIDRTVARSEESFEFV